MRFVLSRGLLNFMKTGLLLGRTARGTVRAFRAGHLQHRPRLPVHQRGIHRRCGGTLLNAFCFGDEADEPNAPGWPLNPDQELAAGTADRRLDREGGGSCRP